ncbi:hypothetical protein CI109_103202 [Kwoniella shandongensis]|uniref:Uncharacterized protein n=1 Tax=Kwoniella shandongensis TaxID=1734106 RepID=A0A5M6CAF2_9TREE|nr:uncharacterized protein CI109_000392 [Kwoniella shandongensis]KAA5531550.1 hypothetical protein CI109_000392 [Kwoniella shandongensis]
MFKLLKDLTRPPETLSPPPSTPGSSTPVPYAARQRARSSSQVAAARARSKSPGTAGTSRGRSPAPPGFSHTHSHGHGHDHGDSGWSLTLDVGGEGEEDEDVDETEEGAIKVVELLRELRNCLDGQDIMPYVETFSQLLSVPGDFHSRRAFRRHAGFRTLLTVLGESLVWTVKPKEGEGSNEEAWQVREVQRMEGIRLCLEVLAWAVGDRHGESHFESHGGYRALLPILYRLLQHTSSKRIEPESQIIALLLSHICNDNYSIVSLFQTHRTAKHAPELTTAFITSRLGDVIIRPSTSGALRLLWAYIRGESSKGKGKERAWTGDFETGEEEYQAKLIELTLQTLLVAAQASTPNLFALATQIPDLAEFLITRLYGPDEKRVYEETFPARADWQEREPEDEDLGDANWQGPDDGLRRIYIALLRRVLEAGVNQRVTWRLFGLVKTTIPPTERHFKSNGESSSSLVSGDGTSTTPDSVDSEPDRIVQRTKQKPNLHISTTDTQAEGDEGLHAEVLDLIRHSMKARWPDVFVFRGGAGDSLGGLQLRETGRAWMNAHKGFNFSCWLHISKLNQPLTLLHMSQKGAKQPLFQIRILESSQIAITTSVHGADNPPTTPISEDPPTLHDNEVICGAMDALIPHFQWVHFAVGCRKPRGSEHGEIRIFVNGVRVGALRMPFPVPSPATTAPTAPQLNVKQGTPPDAVRIAIGRPYKTDEECTADKDVKGGREEENEWMLGRTLLLEEAVPEDMVLLMHHLGPRYTGNLQEPAGKFLTYEGATSINIYLSNLAQTANDRKFFSHQSSSILVRAIRAGHTIPEESIILSLAARDYDPTHDVCVNAGVPHPHRAKQLRHGTVRLFGHVRPFSATSLDESVSAVGGGLVVLKMVDLAKTREELTTTLGILRDMIKDSWEASEEMERIHGFDLLAALLRPRMSTMVDEHIAKIILSMLGINMDKPNTATVHNSVAYRSLGLEFELWSYAPDDVIIYYLKHFEYLLSTSKHKRFNILRTFQKSAMVKKMLYALRSGLFSLEVLPNVVEVLKLALEARWSGEDAIKPVFSYLVSALCQNNMSFSTTLTDEPPPYQLPAALILGMIAQLCQSKQRLVKLNRSLALHRLLVIFLSSNSAYYVVLPCLEILELCLITTGLETFQRSFESEGGFALLAGTLAPIWRSDIQVLVIKMLMGQGREEKAGLLSPPMVACLLAALDFLLQQAGDMDDGGNRPTTGRTRSGTITSIKSIAFSPVTPDSPSFSQDDTRLEDLLKEMTAVYRASPSFRKNITAKKVEVMLPSVADFAAVSGSNAKPEVVRGARDAAAEWLLALIELGKLPPATTNQMNLIIEQLRITPSSPKTGSSLMMSPTSPRPGSSYLGQSFSSRFGASPVPPSSVRRRLSTDVPGFSRSRPPIMEKRVPLKRVITGESILEGGKDKNAAWKMIIIQTDSQSHSKMTLERKEHWQKLSQVDWPRQAAALRAENGLWPEREEGVTWRLDGSEGPLRMRARLERINALPEQGMARTRHKLRDAIPSVDELSSAVSRINAAPWEDPFALALGDAAPEPIAEEEAQSVSVAMTTPSNSAISGPGTLAPGGGGSGPGSEIGAVSEDNVDTESYVEVDEDVGNDKMRRIAKTLQAGDVVEEAHNIVRIVGVDACPGLLILGKKNLYLVDGLVQTADGEVIDAKDAQKDVLSIPSGTLVELDNSDQQSHRWSYTEIVENNRRAFLFRDVALELYFSDKRNFLIVFRDKRERQAVVSKISSKNDHRDAISRSVIGNFVVDTVAKAMDRSEQQLEALQRKWQSREISNFAYLQLLNQYANRTPNDVTQYPVFPWVLSDYTSDKLDLDAISSFRDLTHPMGALTPARREAAIERYSATEGVGEKPFHYGTHYSSSMIVCGFMIRLSPFTEIFLALQGGNFDLADRLFSSIPRAWESASAENRGDVRELIPEFFYSPAFLVNLNHHYFGKKQASGEKVDNVHLPPWALNDPLLFIHRHREALESEYVSRHLAAWIDLTFGYKQRDPAAYNCFHPLSYRGAVDLENIEDEGEKAASTAIIHNFGQTPLQIFKHPHPNRFVAGRSTLPITARFGVAEHWQLMFRSILPITETTISIDEISGPHGPDAKPKAGQKFRLVVPGLSTLSVQYGFTDGSVRVYHQEGTSAKLVSLVEGIYPAHAIFASPSLLVTVSAQGVLTAWRVNIKGGGYRRGDVTMQREATLRGHPSSVTCLAANTSWSLLVSGSEDGNAMVWDTNRLRYTRTLQTGRTEPIEYCAINEADGHIALASKRHLYLYSLNGHPIASAAVEEAIPSSSDVGSEDEEEDEPFQPEFTGGISFLNREFLKSGALFVIGVGAKVVLYRCVPGAKDLFNADDSDVRPWILIAQGTLHRSDDHVGGDCCMVKFIGETLYAAYEPSEEKNKYALYQWSLPDGAARHVAENLSHTCMSERCSRHFGLLEPKRHCGGCGGAFCGTHALHVETFTMRYCDSCRTQLSIASAQGILKGRKDSLMPPSGPASRRGSFGEGSRQSRSQSQPGSRRGSRD